jgi:uncharacterized protein YbjT (DUF2867 family)
MCTLICSCAGHAARTRGSDPVIVRCMKVTVMGASGLIGAKVVELLKKQGHDVVASSRSTGADVLTGAGPADALAGADALIDVTNSPKLEGGPAMEFYSIVRATRFAEFTLRSPTR